MSSAFMLVKRFITPNDIKVMLSYKFMPLNVVEVLYRVLFHYCGLKFVMCLMALFNHLFNMRVEKFVDERTGLIGRLPL